MKPFRHPVITKRFAFKAALYRREARSMLQPGQTKFTFTAVDLLELFLLESRGVGPSFATMKGRNGFAYGKWVRDLSVAMMVESVTGGDACKAEFLDGTIQRMHNWPILAGIRAPAWFPFAALREERRSHA